MIKIETCSLNGLCLTLADEQSAKVLDDITWFVAEMRHHLGEHIVDIVPAYVTVTLYFNPHSISRFELAKKLRLIFANKPDQLTQKAFTTHHMPVWYDPEICPDLASCALSSGMSVDQLVQLHCQSPYRVYAIGFMPGFAYLGDLPKPLQFSRKATPRLNVPKGAVAIAERQTAIYPAQTPGGWQVLGLCPTPLIDMNKPDIGLLEVGDEVIFHPINEQEFQKLGGEVNKLGVLDE